jgi:hypothetical protein
MSIRRILRLKCKLYLAELLPSSRKLKFEKITLVYWIILVALDTVTPLRLFAMCYKHFSEERNVIIQITKTFSAWNAITCISLSLALKQAYFENTFCVIFQDNFSVSEMYAKHH